MCVRGEFVAKIQVCLQTFEFFRSQTLISCVYLDCVVHDQSNKSNIKVSALQASVLSTRPDMPTALLTVISGTQNSASMDA